MGGAYTTLDQNGNIVGNPPGLMTLTNTGSMTRTAGGFRGSMDNSGIVNDGVGVENQYVLAPARADADIVRLCEPQISTILKDVNLGI